MRKVLAFSVILALLTVGVMACSSEKADGFSAAPIAAETGKLVKKPKIGGPSKPVIGKPKNK